MPAVIHRLVLSPVLLVTRTWSTPPLAVTVYSFPRGSTRLLVARQQGEPCVVRDLAMYLTRCVSGGGRRRLRRMLGMDTAHQFDHRLLSLSIATTSLSLSLSPTSPRACPSKTQPVRQWPRQPLPGLCVCGCGVDVSVWVRAHALVRVVHRPSSMWGIPALFLSIRNNCPSLSLLSVPSSVPTSPLATLSPPCMSPAAARRAQFSPHLRTAHRRRRLVGRSVGRSDALPHADRRCVGRVGRARSHTPPPRHCPLPAVLPFLSVIITTSGPFIRLHSPSHSYCSRFCGLTHNPHHRQPRRRRRQQQHSKLLRPPSPFTLPVVDQDVFLARPAAKGTEQSSLAVLSSCPFLLDTI